MPCGVNFNQSTGVQPTCYRHYFSSGPKNHLARFVVDVVDQLDLSKLVKRYAGGGKQPYHSALLLDLLFYCYAIGAFSIRELKRIHAH